MNLTESLSPYATQALTDWATEPLSYPTIDQVDTVA